MGSRRNSEDNSNGQIGSYPIEKMRKISCRLENKGDTALPTKIKEFMVEQRC